MTGFEKARYTLWRGMIAGLKFGSLAGTAGLMVIEPPTASAETLRSALQKTIELSPTLSARRASLAAESETIVQAKIEGRPSAFVYAGITENLRYQLSSVFNPDRRTRADLAIDIPLYLGGRVKNAVRAEILSYRASWRNTEAATSELLLNAVIAYVDVLREQAVLELAEEEVSRLVSNHRGVEGQFRIGDLTLTDVSQSEARIALARADVDSAKARLLRAREEYTTIVGDAPEGLEKPEFELPSAATEAEAIQTALDSNEILRAARLRIEASDYRVKAAKAERLPRISASTSVRYFNYLNSITSELPYEPKQQGTAVEVGITAEIPIYQGGGPSSLVRQAIHQQTQAAQEWIDTERTVVSQVRTAYSTLNLLASQYRQAALAVSANQKALRGARIEFEMGTRTLLNVLDAQQELFQAQTVRVSIERDIFIAKFGLAAAMGQTSPANLGLVDSDNTAFIGPPKPRFSWSDWSDQVPRP